jgi:NitT/TauT family transport system substrate-binding protein
MSRKHTLIALVSILTLTLTSCGQETEPASLRVAVLPILDTLPVYVAAEEGLFAAQGVAVEFVTAASAAERDQMLQAGKVDATITDLVALALYNRDATRVVAVRYAMTPTPQFAQFRVLASEQSGITAVDELTGVPIGISEGTVIEYVTERLLEAEGLSSDAIQTLGVPKIPDRMALLDSGELQAATLPEPLGSLAMQKGAVAVVDDTEHPDVSCSVYAFRKDLVDAQPEAVRGFLAAVAQASTAINADKDRWSDLLAEKNLVPEPLLDAYELPDYPGNHIPNEAQFTDAAAWLQATDRLQEAPSYAASVDGSLLP